MDLQLAGNIFGTVYLRGPKFEFLYHEAAIAAGAGATSTCTCTTTTTTTTSSSTTVGNDTIDVLDPPTRLDGTNWRAFQVHRGGRSNMA